MQLIKNFILRTAFVAALIALFGTVGAYARVPIDYGRAHKLVEADVHMLIGGSTITENYVSCYPEIREMNTSPGTSVGLGLTGVLGVREWLGIGVQLNLLANNFRTDLAVSDEAARTQSVVFLRNRVYYANIPVYAQFRFNLAAGIRWKVDAGLYYSYGLGGKQKQSIYHSEVNILGQLVPTDVVVEPGYFNTPQTFINSNYRGDIGIHIGSGIAFKRFNVGAWMQMGLKNMAYVPQGTPIYKSPNVHNASYRVVIGYNF